MMIWILIGLLVAIIFILYMVKHSYASAKYPPLAPSPMLTNMTTNGYKHITSKYDLCEWCADHTTQDTKSGAVFRIRMPFIYPVAVCGDYKLARIILSGDNSLGIEESEKTPLMKMFNLYQGINSIISHRTSNSEREKTRKFIAPAFSTSNLQQRTSSSFTQHTDHLFSLLRQHVTSHQPVNLLDAIIHTIFHTLTESLFSISSSGFDAQGYFEAQELTLREATKRVTNPFRQFFFWDNSLRRAERAREILKQFGKTVLSTYRASAEESGDSRRNTIMDYLMRNAYPTDEHRITDLIVFMIAGHETTAHTLTFLLYCIATNASARQQLHEELDRTFPAGVPPTASQLSSLEYFHCCLKESMRLYPVAAGVGRQTTQDIHYNNMIIPKHSIVIVHFYSMFRARWIENRLQYDPSRWLESSPQCAELKEMFMPFSAGKRNCIGQSLAMMELRQLGAYLLRNFDFEVVEEPSLDFFLTLKFDKLMVKVTARN